LLRNIFIVSAIALFNIISVKTKIIITNNILSYFLTTNGTKNGFCHILY